MKHLQCMELRALGQIRLLSDDGTEADAVLRQPKRLALLSYLAIPATGTWHRRDVLLGLFWPELDESHARASLRSALYALRQGLGDAMIRTRGDEDVSVDPQLLRTDVGRVWDALNAKDVDVALAEYRGDLLPGLFPPGSEGFQRWLDAERSRLKSAMIVAVTKHTSILEASGDNARALAVTRRLMEIEPDDETIVRRAMALHEAVGDRAGALAVFENFKQRLAADFEAEPAPETIAIANRLRGCATLQPRTKARAPIALSAPPPDALIAAADADAVNSPNLVKGAGHGRSQTRSRSRVFVFAGGVFAAMIAIAAWRSSRVERPMSIGHSGPLTSEEGLQVEAAISPNGRLVAYAKGNRSALRIFVQKIGGGPAWSLTSDSGAVELMPRWATDNDQILFLSRANAYVAPSVGGSPQIVARGTEGDGMVRSASWSPTGDSILIVRDDSLIVMPLQGLGSRYVGTGRQIHSCVWSPDGSRIACVSGNWLSFEPGPLFGNEAPSAVIVFNAASGTAVDVTGPQFRNRSPAWSADSRFLWMLSDRGGTPGEAYAVPLDNDGRPSGDYVRAGIVAESIDLSSNRIAYSVQVRRANVWSVPVPSDRILSFADARQVTTGTQLIETVNASSDGKWLVYDSNLYGNADEFRIPIEGGSAERLTDDPRPEYMGTVSPDGRELAFHRWIKGSRRLFVRNLSNGLEIEACPTDSGDQGSPQWSPDGRSIALWRHEKEQGASFVVHRGADGKWQQPAWKLAGAQLPSWSADGKMLAFVRYDGGIDAMAADSGPRRNVYTRRRGTDDPIASNIVWKIDQATIWFIGSDESGRGGIWSVPAVGGAPRLRVRLDDPSRRMHGPTVASDGKNFYFTIDERFSNMRWAELTRH
ncbi:MAG: BTAD domain-containing putative transcriptional regulator [Gemmatimonadaceae bacterium]